MIDDAVIDLIRTASQGDPFSVLGMHADARGSLWARAFLPGATQVTVLDAADSKPLAKPEPRHPDGKRADQLRFIRRFVPEKMFEKRFRKEMKLPA